MPLSLASYLHSFYITYSFTKCDIYCCAVLVNKLIWCDLNFGMRFVWFWYAPIGILVLFSYGADNQRAQWCVRSTVQPLQAANSEQSAAACLPAAMHPAACAISCLRRTNRAFQITLQSIVLRRSSINYSLNVTCCCSSQWWWWGGGRLLLNR